MNIIEQIKALPKGENVNWGDPLDATNTALRTDDVVALAESHERLLAAAQNTLTLLEGVDLPAGVGQLSLALAIEQAEKLHDQ